MGAEVVSHVLLPMTLWSTSCLIISVTQTFNSHCDSLRSLAEEETGPGGPGTCWRSHSQCALEEPGEEPGSQAAEPSLDHSALLPVL